MKPKESSYTIKFTVKAKTALKKIQAKQWLKTGIKPTIPEVVNKLLIQTLKK